MARSSLSQVRARIALLRAQTAAATDAKAFDFEARLAALASEEDARRKAEREKRVKEREEKRERKRTERRGVQGGEDVLALMGFGGFGSKKMK